MTNDNQVYRNQGFGAELSLMPRYGLLLVDFVNGFADPDKFGGGNIGAAMEQSAGLLEYARRKGWPIAHSRIVYAEDGSDANIFAQKVPSLLALTENVHDSQIVTSLAARSGEMVVRKTTPSAFFGTMLGSWLAQRNVRTLVVAGSTTSGCVRASVVDAMCLGFAPVVASDCVGDRVLAPHNASLFDMSQKYALVMTADELTAAFN
ncbi:isochorismatase family protein [Pusillimonas noertemannii]|uniref:isochorismatase family protein n=1 Tax=Pusillimonas noertemannii TaxID=305977 RepID=UPI00036D2205|nr:isochorismatase family protein [Pusillimonas noertemannii]